MGIQLYLQLDQLSGWHNYPAIFLHARCCLVYPLIHHFVQVLVFTPKVVSAKLGWWIESQCSHLLELRFQVCHNTHMTYSSHCNLYPTHTPYHGVHKWSILWSLFICCASCHTAHRKAKLLLAAVHRAFHKPYIQLSMPLYARTLLSSLPAVLSLVFGKRLGPRCQTSPLICRLHSHKNLQCVGWLMWWWKEGVLISPWWFT